MPHPGDIAEPSSLSAIPLPPTDYPLWAALPEAVVSSGKLSQLQLEGIIYACSKHLCWLPSGEQDGRQALIACPLVRPATCHALHAERVFMLRDVSCLQASAAGSS